MSFCCLMKPKPSIVLIVFVIMTTAMTGNSVNAVIPPCPVVADVTITQMAQQWAEMFRDPYRGFLEEKQNILLKQKLAGGTFGFAGQLTGIFKTSEETPISVVAKTAGRTEKRIDPKSMGARELANAKVRALRTSASITAYVAGKDSYGKAAQVEKTLQGFAPLAFDFSSKHQVQKDTVKLIYLLGLIQAQELKIISLLKMMHAVEGEH